MRKNNTEDILFHSVPENLPKNSFIQITDAVAICSPELCFLQAAKELTLPELVLLGYDLCATYVRDPQEPFLQRKREPVTTVSSIAEYLLQIEKTKGVQRARKALPYILDNSNSPMESRLATLGVIPLCHGGQGLEKPVLNHVVQFTKKAANVAGAGYCICDMVWPAQKVVLEYDSNLTHLDTRQHAKDKRRATALALSGYTVISVTADQVRSFSALENLFSMIRSALGMRALTDRKEKYLEKRWEVTHTIMFGKNKREYPI